MYQTLLFLHSFIRWLVLASLLYAIARAYRGYSSGLVFSNTDNSIRHWTATLAHLQLTIGFALYFTSPVIPAFLAHFKQGIAHSNLAFFGMAHPLAMLVSIVIITLGSALAKRQSTDREKFRTLLVWFSVGLALLLLAIPWPFSPFANRPYLRTFTSHLGRLRLIGLLEGISLLVLLGIAVPAKHLYGNAALVKSIGPLHGVLFLLFVLQTLSVGVEQRWKFKTTTWKVLVACLIPFGTFYIDQKILSKIKGTD